LKVAVPLTAIQQTYIFRRSRHTLVPISRLLSQVAGPLPAKANLGCTEWKEQD
jgi:hypothetical protein